MTRRHKPLPPWPARLSRRDLLRLLAASCTTTHATQILGMSPPEILPPPSPSRSSGLQKSRLVHANNPLGFSFVDAAAEAGLGKAINVYGGVRTKRYLMDEMGCGVAFFDYDNDGWLDIFMVNGTRFEALPPGPPPANFLFHNNRDGTFTDVTARAGLVHTGWGQGCCIGDYDNDGFDYRFVTYWGQNVLYHNNGDGTFTDATAKAGLQQAGTPWGSGRSEEHTS